METGYHGKRPSDSPRVRLTIVLGNIKQGRVEEEVENVGKRTPSDVMETGCHGKRPSDSPRVSSRET